MNKNKRNLFNIDTLRLISLTKKRFFSLVCIVFIGSMFMMGLLSTTPIMRESVDEYDDEYNLQDIQIYSTYGFCEEDIEALKNDEVVEEATGSKFVDGIANFGDNATYTVRIKEINSSINQLELIEGRMPEKDDECLAIYMEYDPICSTIGEEFEFNNDTDLTDTLKNTTHLHT